MNSSELASWKIHCSTILLNVVLLAGRRDRVVGHSFPSLHVVVFWPTLPSGDMFGYHGSHTQMTRISLSRFVPKKSLQHSTSRGSRRCRQQELIAHTFSDKTPLMHRSSGQRRGFGMCKFLRSLQNGCRNPCISFL